MTFQDLTSMSMAVVSSGHDDKLNPELTCFQMGLQYI